MKANGITVTPNGYGIYILNDSTGKGNPVSLNNVVMYNYNAYTITGASKVLYDTSDTLTAKTQGLIPNFEYGGPCYQIVNSTIPVGLEVAFLTMNAGGASDFIIPSTDWDNQGIPRYYHISLIYTSTSLFGYQESQITNYLDSEKYNKQLPTPLTLADSISYNGVTGVYYIPIDSGIGSTPVKNQTANVNISMKLINGPTFFTTTNFTEIFGESNDLFSTGDGYVYVPTGFDVGLSKMKPGGSAIFVLPYNDAFQTVLYNYTSSGYQIAVQPGSPLVIYVKLNSLSTK